MKGKIGDGVRLQHVVEVDNYLKNCTLEQFISNSEKRFATIKQLEIIGEACNAITRELKSKHPEIPWKSIIGFRNISIHEYFGVSLQLAWQIAINDLPAVRVQIEDILAKLI
jgi:uncharacterized protein with HEPN domain